MEAWIVGKRIFSVSEGAGAANSPQIRCVTWSAKPTVGSKPALSTSWFSCVHGVKMCLKHHFDMQAVGSLYRRSTSNCNIDTDTDTDGGFLMPAM